MCKVTIYVRYVKTRQRQIKRMDRCKCRDGGDYKSGRKDRYKDRWAKVKVKAKVEVEVKVEVTLEVR